MPDRPDPKNVRLITDAISRGLREVHSLRLVPLAEDIEEPAFDRSAREDLERFERAHKALKAEESER